MGARGDHHLVGSLAPAIRQFDCHAIFAACSAADAGLQPDATVAGEPGMESRDQRLRVADMARSAGYSRVIIAENASDSAMLRALEAWQTTVGE